MRNSPAARRLDGVVPTWVPESAVHYLAHIEAGLPIRELARNAGCHASTVLRQIRRFESRREDPLVDSALCRLGRAVPSLETGSHRKEKRMAATSQTDCAIDQDDKTLTEAELRREGLRVLRRLCEPGALLVVAANMDKAVVVRDREGADPTRTGVVEKAVAEAMALKGWIQCGQAGRITRYTVSPAGRDMLGRLMAEAENAAVGFSEAQTLFQGQGGDGLADAERASQKRKRYSGTESPMMVLARRKDKTGEPFLPDHLVRAGERLREDFELANMADRGEENWDIYLTDTVDKMPAGAAPNTPAGQARDRVVGALSDLGLGLGDVALRCCCYLEGLEQAEKRMGWSARSGKVVLRIALQRLHRHYAELGDAGQMIG